MAGPPELAPTERGKVYDLVREAGADVSDWSNYKTPEYPAKNPRYCYDWAFVDPGRLVVLCLWHAEMEHDEARVWHDFDTHDFMARLRASGGPSNWIARAKRQARALQTAYEDALPVRVIVLEGDMRGLHDTQRRSSKVAKRLLDPAPWAVTRGDVEAGVYLLERGAQPPGFVDQFSIDAAGQNIPERREVAGSVFARDAAVRARALARASGHCERCGAAGFRTRRGGIYLETHHIVPLGENGPDVDSNVIALCPNDHREAHHGEDCAAIRQELAALVRAKVRS